MRPITEKEVELRIAAGESIRSIARSFGVSHQAICWRRDQWGAKRTRKPTHPGKRRSGGRFVDCWGYVMVRTSNRAGAKAYTPEHVLVAQNTLNRKLQKGERVHHINGLKNDNRPENLIVFSTQSEHKQVHANLESLAMQLVQDGKIAFRDGAYCLA